MGLSFGTGRQAGAVCEYCGSESEECSHMALSSGAWLPSEGVCVCVCVCVCVSF